jgi:UV DNA damage endonuclease
MASKRKRSTAVESSAVADSKAEAPRPRQRTAVPLPANVAGTAPRPTRRQSTRAGAAAITNPDVNPDVVDGTSALRASPDSSEIPDVGPAVKRRKGEAIGAAVSGNGDGASPNVTSAKDTGSTSIAPPPADELGHEQQIAVSAVAETGPAAEQADVQPGRNKRKKAPQHAKANNADPASGTKVEKDVGVTADPEVDGALTAPDEVEDEEEIKQALSRRPPVNSDYLPLPWKGRLGYVRTPHSTHPQANRRDRHA